MATRATKKVPYKEKSDAGKVLSNWKKTLKLYKRHEYSVCIIRAATSAELMVNLALRHELVTLRNLPKPFVDGLMKRANGIVGKFHGLLLPILEDDPKHAAVSGLKKPLDVINDQRNKVVHQGEFKKKSTAFGVLTQAHSFISQLQFYDTSVVIELPEPPTAEAKTRN